MVFLVFLRQFKLVQESHVVFSLIFPGSFCAAVLLSFHLQAQPPDSEQPGRIPPSCAIKITFHRLEFLIVNLDDTIVAIATPHGRGGIGIVRLAGHEARPDCVTMLRLKHELEAGQAVFCELVDTQNSSSERIDEVIVTYFAKPHSYTTDDILEISAHGSPVVLAHIVEMALARGARLAEPGEFTMRAFLNGRIDLTQAEAVRDSTSADALSGKDCGTAVRWSTLPTATTDQTETDQSHRHTRSRS